MRAEDWTPAALRRAIDVFVELGFPPGSKSAPLVTSAKFEQHTTLAASLACFKVDDDGGPGARKLSLQIGNEQYLFSKLLLCEYLVEGHYFLSVETHDNLPLPPGHAEFEKFRAIRRHNRDLKLRIEAAWREQSLSTFVDLRGLCESLAELEREPRKDIRLLVVDDEREIALAVAALARGRGYDAEVAFDGAEVLARLSREPLPELALLDYELPDRDGGELCRFMRDDPRFARTKIVMATAARISLAKLGPVHGFLRKPYQRQMLFSTLKNLSGAAKS